MTTNDRISNMFSERKDSTNACLAKWLTEQQQFEQNGCRLKANIDDLNGKDQQLDRQFRQFFGEIVTSTVVEQTYRIYK